MSLYNMLFGKNPLSEAILATLGLNQKDVGRFRDCYISNGEICVYTRNGGGNRVCWHADNPKYGNKECGGEAYEVEVDETVEVTEDEAKKKGYKLLNVFIGDKRLANTGKRIMQTRYTCEQPCSIKCSCPGCTVNYRLPAHPLYKRDEDDEFDSTYCTIYFDFPKEFSEELKKLESKEPFEPSKMWIDLIEKLKS